MPNHLLDSNKFITIFNKRVYSIIKYLYGISHINVTNGYFNII